jgi:hypothetical protein
MNVANGRGEGGLCERISMTFSPPPCFCIVVCNEEGGGGFLTKKFLST